MSFSLSIADLPLPSAAEFQSRATKIISASDETISIATGKTVSLLGDDDILLGSGYWVTAASDLSVTLGGEGALGAGIVFIGTHDVVTAAAGTHLKLKGSDDQLVAEGAMNLVLRGLGDAVQGSSIGINLLGGSNLQLTGSGDSLTVAEADTVTLIRASNTTISGEGYTVEGDVLTDVTLGANFGGEAIVFAADASSLNVEANSLVSVTGGGNTIVAGADSRLKLSGADDTFTGATGDVVVVSGDDDVLLGGGYRVKLADSLWATLGGNGASGPVIAVLGSGDILGAMANSNISITGSNDHFVSHGSSALAACGSSNVIAAASGDSITLSGGSGNEVTVGLNDIVNDLGSSDTIGVFGNVGKLVLNGFGADAHGLVDINAGNYTTVAAIVAALTSDGHGGTLLSLGADGSIDFVGVATSKLGASHFSIN